MKSIMKTSQASDLRSSSRPQRRLRNLRRLASWVVESLETRQLLTVGPLSSTAIPAPLWTPTDSNVYDAQNGPMANFGTELVAVYQAYETELAQATKSATSSKATPAAVADSLASQFSTIQFDNGLVGMDIKSLGGDFNQFLGTLSSLGMQITASTSAYGIAEGWVPVAELPTIARLSQTLAGSPIPVPIQNVSAAPLGYQGVADNESATSLSAEAARSQFGVTGAGVTVGVLSDSVSKSGSGLTGSYNTGDLSSSNPVKVIQDGTNGSTDEGRAMLENIHDIAPSANLQFATAARGEVSFMNNIEALYNAGSSVIVDDEGYFDEPMFQDGLIAQGVDYVTSRGAEYFSAAGNEGPDSGYASTFRSDVTTVNGISGNFMNFNPNGGTANPLLPISTGVSQAFITFEYDQPYGTQQPTGSTAKVTSTVHFYVFNSSGSVVASGTNNNIATDAPIQEVQVPSTGNYFVAMVVTAGSAPGHVEFLGQNDTNGALNVSTEYGSAGGTTYPSSLGHETTAATIGVAATPWWAPSPYIGQTPLANEPYSSSGPQLIDLNPKGQAITPQIVQNPAITAPDGGSTSFFGFKISTTDPAPIGGEPSSSFNMLSTNQQTYNNFFGTSSASPNAAAVTALMLQEVPTLTRTQIVQALESTATPMNGTAAGTWNSQSGYGLINAVAAIQSVAPSALASSTVTVTPATTKPTVNVSTSISVTAAGSGGTPTGTLDFYDISYNTDIIGATLSSGQATLTFTPTQTGAHVYLISYSGDSTYAKSTAYVVLNVVAATQAVTVKIPTLAPFGLSATESKQTGTTALTALYFLPTPSAASIPISTSVMLPATVESESVDAMAFDIASLTTIDSGNPLLKKSSS